MKRPPAALGHPHKQAPHPSSTVTHNMALFARRMTPLIRQTAANAARAASSQPAVLNRDMGKNQCTFG